MDQSVTLNIDGQEVTVPAGTSVLDAASLAGIEIPSLCNHEKLLPAGLCRLCLVEIERMPGLQAACATTVREGMAVHTGTPAVLHNRRLVLELLCTNHPLDCPVCDAAGDCHLQDYVFRYGRTDSRFVEEKRHKGKAIRLGPAVILDQERCVLCQRCVRFCDEILDDRQLAVFQRGASSRISTLPGRAFDSAFSGNVIDLCPVGAMTDRVSRFQARNWDLQDTHSTCLLCPVGCRLTLKVRNGRLIRVSGREAPEVNDGWLCDLGRTGHGFVDAPDRLRQPLLRRGDRLEPAGWDEALDAVAAGLRRALEGGGPQAVAALGSARLTNEPAYLLGKLVRTALGSNNLAGRLDEPLPAPAQATPVDLRQADLIVLFQADPGEEAPILELWIKQAVRRGARLYIIHPRTLALDRYATRSLAPRPGSEAVLLAGLLPTTGDAPASLAPVQVASLTGCAAEAVQEVAGALAGAERAVLAYGAGVRDEETVALLVALAQATGARLLGWGRGANARGVADVGLCPNSLPGRAPLGDAEAAARCQHAWGGGTPQAAGLASAEFWGAMQRGEVRALYVLAADPLTDAPAPQAVRSALESADFLVVQDSFLTPTAELADVVLPAALPGEEDGSSTNLAGQVGSHRAGIAPLGESRPHWRILAGLAGRLEAPGAWDYASAADVLAEIARVVPAYAGAPAVLEGGQCDARFEYPVPAADPAGPGPQATVGTGSLILVSGPVLFDRDLLAAHAPAIAARAPEPYVLLNPADAASLGLAAGDAVEVWGPEGTLHLRARISEGCLPGTVFVPQHLGRESVNLLGARPGAVALVDVKPAGERAARGAGEEP